MSNWNFRLDLEHAHAPQGFRTAGLACGIKKRGGPDLMVLHSPEGANAAAMFTKNLVRAAPLELDRAHLLESGGKARVLLVNSGCANAATGPEGKRRAEATARGVAERFGCAAAEVLLNSTGVIGVQLAHEKILAALPEAQASLQEGSLAHAARAIMTTDTRPKMVDLRVDHGGKTLHVAGYAKGAGMIHPNMATMIAVLLTDAEVPAVELDAHLRYAADRSFHRMSIDGDTSTNDAVFALASGNAGAFPAELLREALTRVARELAMMIVKDGEGARKLIRVVVTGARDEADAAKVCWTVASSLLVRTAIAGGDPNWGRIIAAVGRSGVDVIVERIALLACGVPLFRAGAPVDVPRKQQEEVFARAEIELAIDLGLGSSESDFFTCDLTEGYIHINADYTT
ncbi:MAG: bifunctional glutamate N-acetyltransferase/amino-acid acetyltransferase ArgJ [Planctomycetes bacterium]|nr:bifunctional glutamate N-acetyltransferase/amino-acid acetyltransferase ArgJ [Planctomycetota bacterium]